jgi:NADH-quinone oxidoreductase subunit N
VCIVLLMLSLIGVPPLAGFFGKLYMFMEALNADEPQRLTMIWLVALALFNSVVSAFYYVRVLRAMYLRQPAARTMGDAPGGISRPIVLATLVVVAFGVFNTPLLEGMAQAAVPMLSPNASSGYVPDAAAGATGSGNSPAAEQAKAYQRSLIPGAPKLVPPRFNPGGRGGPPDAPATKKAETAPAKKEAESATPKKEPESAPTKKKAEEEKPLSTSGPKR